MVAESFRGVRANLLFSLPAEQLHTVLVTSPRPEEGKTTVAANLATALSQMGKRILLVDANFRRPRLQALLRRPPRQGLSHLLVGAGRLAESVAAEGSGNLHVLVAGPAPPSAADVIETGAFDRFLTEAREHYDLIVIDGPPVLSAAETVQIAKLVDGVVLVCLARSTRYGVANRAREILEQAGARILGGVLNGVHTQPGGYYESAIRSYYEYRSGEGEMPEFAADRARMSRDLPKTSPPADEDG
jgi:capsular exopolysaccharide synthesis family protein